MTLCFYIKPYEMYAGLTSNNIGLGETCSQILIREAKHGSHYWDTRSTLSSAPALNLQEAL